jgi:hypothetical protein
MKAVHSQQVQYRQRQSSHRYFFLTKSADDTFSTKTPRLPRFSAIIFEHKKKVKIFLVSMNKSKQNF